MVRADSLAVSRGRVVAVGNRLEHDPDFKSYERHDLKGKTVIPGFVDAHTHFVYFANSLGKIKLNDCKSVDACLKTVKRHASRMSGKDWIIGDGLTIEQFRPRREPTRYDLDKVTGHRPAFILTKDHHLAWVNSAALKAAGITKRTPDPKGGMIECDADGHPTGIIRETPSFDLVLKHLKRPSKRQLDQAYEKALQHAYSQGVTGIHSFDYELEALQYLIARRNKTGLRINIYPEARNMPALRKSEIDDLRDNEWFRIAGIKIYSDGALGSQTALCFNQYQGSKRNRGIEVTSVPLMTKHIKQAARLGLPCAIHAIGDQAVDNVLTAMEKAASPTKVGRHRIEHLQLVRRKDLARVRKLGVVASMQPSHCPSDMDMIHKYWGGRGKNAFVFRTVIDQGIDYAFGSDCPIEPLNPIAGIAAAVRRARRGKRDVFYPEQRITATEALYGFTVGSAIASGEFDRRGRLLPGFPADFAVLSQDPTRIAPARIYETEVLATVLDGQVKYCRRPLNL